MPSLDISITVARPAPEVFAYVTDFSRWPEWRKAVSWAEVTTGAPVGAGTLVALAGEAMGRTVDMELEVTSYVPDREIGFRLISGALSGHAEFRLEPNGSATLVRVTGSIEPGGLLKLAGPVAGRQAQQMWAADLAALKAALER